MKNKLIILSIFSGGLVMGLILYHFLLINALPAHRQVIKTSLLTEAEFSASREERNGNYIIAAFHRWNAIRLNNPESIKTFSESGLSDIEKGLFAPLVLLTLNKMSMASDPQRKGADILEGLNRGHLAHLLEKIGFDKMAFTQWKKSAKIINLDLAKTKKLIDTLRNQANEEPHKKAEEAVLGRTTVGWQ